MARTLIHPPVRRAACRTAAGVALFAANGYPAAYLAIALKSLDDFSTADLVQNEAIRAAVKATAERDAAFAALDKWMKVFARIAGLALKIRPDLLKKLNL